MERDSHTSKYSNHCDDIDQILIDLENKGQFKSNGNVITGKIDQFFIMFSRKTPAQKKMTGVQSLDQRGLL